jgi:hypothetical protein
MRPDPRKYLWDAASAAEQVLRERLPELLRVMRAILDSA